MIELPQLGDDERARYEWQMWTSGHGEEGQRKLKQTSVLISRIGGLGGTVAYYLAAAGIGRLVLAHAGNVKPSDLNRQLLMTTDWLGKARVESAARRLQELNPFVEIETVAENLSNENAKRLVGCADIVVDAAPLFAERFAMNSAAFRQGKPIIESAMYDFDAQLTTMIPGQTACLACLVPENPPQWRREFPVFGAVSGTIAAMAALEVIKLVAGFGETLAGTMCLANLRTMEFRRIAIQRDPNCRVCGGQEPNAS
ncbi:MAG: HesA/MoeB/ThiF family protein [Planctomycetales bacterium]|nr:HesA/MoeB/ThiF family protein [Planctomycetales bacterium]